MAKPKNIRLLLIWILIINSAFNYLSRLPYPTHFHFYPKRGRVFPKFEMITNFMLAWHDVSNRSNHNGKKIQLRFSILELKIRKKKLIKPTADFVYSG